MRKRENLNGTKTTSFATGVGSLYQILVSRSRSELPSNASLEEALKRVALPIKIVDDLSACKKSSWSGVIGDSIRRTYRV